MEWANHDATVHHIWNNSNYLRVSLTIFIKCVFLDTHCISHYDENCYYLWSARLWCDVLVINFLLVWKSRDSSCVLQNLLLLFKIITKPVNVLKFHLHGNVRILRQPNTHQFHKVSDRTFLWTPWFQMMLQENMFCEIYFWLLILSCNYNQGTQLSLLWIKYYNGVR